MLSWSRQYRISSHFVQYSHLRSNFCTNATRAQKSITSDVTIIGGGISGLASIQRLCKYGFTVNAIESGMDLGGTWFWNRYPGAVCDIESMQYSFTGQFDAQLQQEWNWTQKYSTQAEILSYLNHVADRFDLRKHIHFGQTVEKCTYSESNSNWIVETNTGHAYTSSMLILATGVLSIPNQPQYDGLEHYKGCVYYTSKWPENPVDFSDKRVAIIGTGSSGVQLIPKIAQTAKHLTVYQRTAQYVCPLNNKELSDKEQQTIKDNYDEMREIATHKPFGINVNVNEKKFDEMSVEEYESEVLNRWNTTGGFSIIFSCLDQLINKDADSSLAKFIRKRIRKTVLDEKVADLLCPSESTLYACKRPLNGTNYFETYNQNNVELVSISEANENGTPINCITSNSIITSDDVERECDVLIFATGFDAMTGATLKIDIKGRNNQTIQDCWKDGAKSYLGLQTVGFPNMFTICGPYSPSVFWSQIVAIEQHVNWIVDLFVYMKKNNLTLVEPTDKAQQQWIQCNAEIAQQYLVASSSCNSWYHGSNINGKKRDFLPSLMRIDEYTEKCNNVAKQNYVGFDFDLQSQKQQPK